MTGAQLLAFREARGLTQDALGELLGLAGSGEGSKSSRAVAVRRWENGQRPIPSYIERIVKLLEENGR